MFCESEAELTLSTSLATFFEIVLRNGVCVKLYRCLFPLKWPATVVFMRRGALQFLAYFGSWISMVIANLNTELSFTFLTNGVAS